jgi:hypothetical protein
MTNHDQDTVLGAIADVRRILREPDARLTPSTADRLIAVVERDEVVRH